MNIELRKNPAIDTSHKVVRHVRRTCVVVCVFTVLNCGTADAQLNALVGRVSLHVNGGFQSSIEFQAVLPFRVYGEDERFQMNHRIEGGGIIAAGGSVRLWRQLSLGATFSALGTSDDATLTGSVPHPFLVNSSRTVASQALAFKYRERGTHFHVAWVVPISSNGHLDVTILGGPSLFNVTREVFSDISVLETGPPFSDVTVDVGKREHSSNGWGGHVGADVTYMVTNAVGLGGFVRFAAGSVDVPIGTETVSSDVGGAQTGGGVRIRF